MLAAGSLNRSLLIESRTIGVDAWGEEAATWSTFATVKANVRAPTGLASAERIAGDQEISVTAYSARIRYRTDITPSMRATLDGLVFDIVQVIHDLAGREHTDLVLVSGASEG